jgi:tetratricopeptide (TPR) repeat protein
MKNSLQHPIRSSDAIGLFFCVLVAAVQVSCVTNLEEEKKEVESYKRIAAEYMAENDYTSALKTLQKAEKIYSDDAELQNHLGLTYKAKGRSDLALIHFKKAVDLRPDYSVAKKNLGTVYMDMAQWDRAIPYLKDAAEDLTYETPHRALSNLGWVYYNKRAYRQAEIYYRKALEYQPKFVLALRGLAVCLIATEKYSEAIDFLEQAVSLAPQIPHLYFDLGEAYSLSGRYDKPRKSYDNKVIDLVPASPLASEAKIQKAKIIGR